MQFKLAETEKCGSTLLCNAPRFSMGLLFEVYKSSPFAVLVTAAYRRKWEYRIGGITQTGKSLSDILSIAKLMWTSQESNPGLFSEKTATNSMNPGTVILRLKFI
jgi:hypothetical protein